MTFRLKTALLLTGLAIAAGSVASAQDYGRRDDSSHNATEFSRSSGGYCDARGCPDHFWKYRIYYGPVYFRGTWFRGPVYVKDDRGRHYFWVAGGWHRDEWHAERPRWARNAYFGPPRPQSYYHGREFQDDSQRQAENYRRDQRDYSGDTRGYDQNRDRRDYSGSGYSDQHSRDYNGEQPSGDYGPDQRPGGGYSGPDNGQSNAWRNGGGQPQQRRRDYRSGDNRQPGTGNNNGGSMSDRRGNWYGGSYPNQGYAQNSRGAGQSGSPPNTITVTSATYGASCKAPKGNVTKFVQTACNGQSTCQYIVQYKTIGDPAPGCVKDFTVEWTCGNGVGGSATAPGEAGLGSKVSLVCNAAR
jgi:hypothetical protein